jgi:CRP-like cAMP-binding protein
MTAYQNMPWFKKLSETSTEKTYRRGEIYSLQGEELNAVALILMGKASEISYSVNGDETWVSEYDEGQFIGLKSLLVSGVTSLEIRAASKLQVLTVSHDQILSLMQEDQDLCKAIAVELAERLNRSVSDIVDMHTLSVRGRICAELLRRALPIGIDPDRQIIRPSPVFVELARRLNSTRETVSRTVSELQNKGILVREPGALVIASPDRLRDAVEHI